MLDGIGKDICLSLAKYILLRFERVNDCEPAVSVVPLMVSVPIIIVKNTTNFFIYQHILVWLQKYKKKCRWKFIQPTALYYQRKGLFLDNLLAILNDDAFYRCVSPAAIEGIKFASSVRPPTFYFLDSRVLVDGTAAAE